MGGPALSWRSDTGFRTVRGCGTTDVRAPEEIAGFFAEAPVYIVHFTQAGLEPVEPGVTRTPLRRPGPGHVAEALNVYCGVARKP